MNKIFLLCFSTVIAKMTFGQCLPLLSTYIPGGSLNCNNNLYAVNNTINTPQNLLNNNARSVFMMEIKDLSGPGKYTCTCTLLRQATASNNDNLQENVFITSRHCIVKNAAGGLTSNNLLDFGNAKFIFNYSNADATNTSNIGCKVSRYVVEGGAQLIDASTPHNMVVMKLVQPIPPHFNVFYSGWSAQIPPTPGSFFDIHHAASDIKKISFATELLALPIPTRHNVLWSSGITQQGSSGSPLFITIPPSNISLIGVLSGNVFAPNSLSFNGYI